METTISGTRMIARLPNMTHPRGAAAVGAGGRADGVDTLDF
jgi:hypothetical protein